MNKQRPATPLVFPDGAPKFRSDPTQCRSELSFGELLEFVYCATWMRLDRVSQIECAIGLAESYHRQDLWEPGDFTQFGFVPWHVKPEIASKRIRVAVVTFQRGADLRRLGEFCWFRPTERGQALREEIDE